MATDTDRRYDVILSPEEVPTMRPTAVCKAVLNTGDRGEGDMHLLVVLSIELWGVTREVKVAINSVYFTYLSAPRPFKVRFTLTDAGLTLTHVQLSEDMPIAAFPDADGWARCVTP